MIPSGYISQKPTPYYYYDTHLLQETLSAIHTEVDETPQFHIHYAVKANAHPHILSIIAKSGLGADCVSGGEIQACLKAGFKASQIVYAGVGKSDWEIEYALDNNIACFNVESIPELEVINEIAMRKGKNAHVALRVNPNVNPHTHEKITTGLAENKFGIALSDLREAVERSVELPAISFIGLHFHIGSQITDMCVFQLLCERINEIVAEVERIIPVHSINVGGGLGIDYETPEKNPIPDFKSYFSIFNNNLVLKPSQALHFELGRSVVGQIGELVTKVLYVKKGTQKNFLIVDAGFTDLIRPALYQAHHKIINATSQSPQTEIYDVVGPICESSDVFATKQELPVTQRGDYLIIQSAGAYGEVMASTYNCRKIITGYCIDDFR